MSPGNISDLHISLCILRVFEKHIFHQSSFLLPHKKTKMKKNPNQPKPEPTPDISLWDMFKKSKERYTMGDHPICSVEHQGNGVVEREHSSCIEN